MLDPRTIFLYVFFSVQCLQPFQILALPFGILLGVPKIQLSSTLYSGEINPIFLPFCMDFAQGFKTVSTVGSKSGAKGGSILYEAGFSTIPECVP